MGHFMRYNRLVKGIVGLIAVAPALATDFSTEVTQQKIAVPSYFYPGATWTKMRQGAPTVGLAIINPNSGPGLKIDLNYVNEVNLSKAAGVVVLGYVPTGYGVRSKAAVKAEILKYQQWYAVDGIFLDETPFSCARKPYYQDLYTYIHSKQSGAIVVLNPGGVTGECFMETSDIVVNFEGSAATYQSWQPAGWEYRYTADRFWHLIYNTPQTALDTIINLSRQRQAGWVYVTSDRMSNPWDSLPGKSYWQQEIVGVGR